MTREEAIKYLKNADITVGCKVKTKTAEALEMAIEALEQEPCEDAVSREFLLGDLLLKAQGEKDVSIKWFEEYINSLPPVTPQDPRKGHWISGKYKDTCNKCRCTYPKNIGFKNFCPNCGAKMVESQESEE